MSSSSLVVRPFRDIDGISLTNNKKGPDRIQNNLSCRPPNKAHPHQCQPTNTIDIGKKTKKRQEKPEWLKKANQQKRRKESREKNKKTALKDKRKP